jgi:hypothetical protein
MQVGLVQWPRTSPEGCIGAPISWAARKSRSVSSHSCTSATMGETIGLAFRGSAADTLLCTMCVEESSSVAFSAR